MLRCALRKLSLLFTLACLSLGATAAHAITIDTFDDPATLVVGPGAGNPPATGTLDGVREYLVTAQGTMDIDSGFPGRLLFTTTGASTLTLNYPTPNMNFDFFGGTGSFELDIYSVSNPATFSISVFVQDGPTGGVGSNTQPFVFPGMFATPGTLSLDFSTFAGVDFADVDVVRMTLAASGPGSIKITEFRAVPEPSTAAMLGLGLFGLAAAGSQRRTA
jgi:hypothetical protein